MTIKPVSELKKSVHIFSTFAHEKIHKIHNAKVRPSIQFFLPFWFNAKKVSFFGGNILQKVTFVLFDITCQTRFF